MKEERPRTAGVVRYYSWNKPLINFLVKHLESVWAIVLHGVLGACNGSLLVPGDLNKHETYLLARTATDS